MDAQSTLKQRDQNWTEKLDEVSKLEEEMGKMIESAGFQGKSG